MSKAIHWTVEHDDCIRRGFAAGLSASQIAEQLHTTRNMVCGRKFRLGIRSPEKVFPPYLEKDIAALLALKRNGMSNGIIAKKLRRSYGSVSTKISKLGIGRHYGVA